MIRNAFSSNCSVYRTLPISYQSDLYSKYANNGHRLNNIKIISLPEFQINKIIRLGIGIF